MQKLSNFVEYINEAGRGRPRKNPLPDTETEKVAGKTIEYLPADHIDNLSDKDRVVLQKKAEMAEKVRGKSEDKNGTKGEWAIDAPYENPEELGIKNMPKELITENSLAIIKRMKEKKPFFIQGKAGWGKTSVIVDCAKRLKRTVITVYLDKAQATDLGGIPVPIQTKNGTAKIVNAMPDWAAYMLEHSDEQFLLFFDEMNQAAPDVMNALMPIVLRNVICNIQFDNFIVGAAGNFEEENEMGINELSGPLTSRFGNKPIIWESDTEETWSSAFAFLEKKYGEKVSKTLFDKVKECKDLFNNPREIEKFIIESCVEAKNDDEKEFWVKTSTILKDIERLAKDDLSRNQSEKMKELAQALYDFIMDAEPKEDPRKSRTKDSDMMSDEFKTQIKNAINRGYITSSDSSDKRKYGISQENFYDVFGTDEYFTDSGINREMLERLVNKLEADGITFKFKTNKEFLDKGYSDPDEE